MTSYFGNFHIVINKIRLVQTKYLLLQSDIQLWLPGKDDRLIKRDKYMQETQKDSKRDWDKNEFRLELAYQIIRQVGDQFCDLIHQEKSVVDEHLSRGIYRLF